MWKRKLGRGVELKEVEESKGPHLSSNQSGKSPGKQSGRKGLNLKSVEEKLFLRQNVGVSGLQPSPSQTLVTCKRMKVVTNSLKN